MRLSPLDTRPARGIILLARGDFAMLRQLRRLITRMPHNDILTRRVCLQLDGMDDVTVRRDVAYGPPDSRLSMNVYYPSDQADERPWPAVIIVAGYPGSREPRPTTLAYKEMGWTVSMCQLIALSGMVAIAYTNN